MFKLVTGRGPVPMQVQLYKSILTAILKPNKDMVADVIPAKLCVIINATTEERRYNCKEFLES